MFTLSAFADEISPDPQEQIDVLTRCGVRCIELRSIHKTNVLDLTDLQIDEFKSLLDRHGFRLSAIGSPVGKIRIDEPFEPHLQRFRRAIELCKIFDTPNIRVFSYYPPGDAADWNGVSDSWQHELFRRLEEQVRLASQAEVRLVHENEHRIYGDSPDRVSRLFEVLPSAAFRAVYDAANYVFCGYDPWEGWQKTKDVTAHFHIKDWVAGAKHGSLAGAGQGRIPEVIADAVKRGYDGFAVLEPHLLGGGPTGGVTGPELFPKAVAAFTAILDKAGAQYQQAGRPMHTVHVRVNDAATGKPTPCRVRFTDAEGRYYAPLGRLTEFATGRNQEVGGNVLIGMKPHAYIDGTCEIRLPVGPVHVQIDKGPEYTPPRLEVKVGPGKLALRFVLERWTDRRAESWYSGDARCHFLTPHAALLEAVAEDLAVVNLLAVECQAPGPFGRGYPAVPNLLAFSGQRPALEAPGHLIAVNTYNVHPVLGSLGLLNCHRVVYPLRSGGPDGVDDWTLADWCDQCHRKGGLVVWANTAHESAGFRFGEPLADLILGKVDAFEIESFEDSPFDALPDWYALLNCGFRVPLAGSSGKENNGMVLGRMRTYAQLPAGAALTYKDWIEAVRAGRSFVTNGPLLSFAAADGGPGAKVVHAAETIRVRAEARSVVPFDRLELIADGKVVAETAANGSPCAAVLEADLPLSRSCWLAARCRGEHQLLHRPANQRVFAHTSPVYVEVPGKPRQPDGAALTRFRTSLEQMLDWVAHEARCANDAQRQRLAGVFEAARLELSGRLGRQP